MLTTSAAFLGILLAVIPFPAHSGAGEDFRWAWNSDRHNHNQDNDLKQRKGSWRPDVPPWELPQQEDPPPTPGPRFEITSANIVTKPGGDVILPCRVINLGDKVVSWIRTKDLHILSSHVFIFTSDSRFSVSHPDGDSASWDLRLKNTRPSDQGLYECQVNTEPKLKQAIMLTISEMALGDSPFDPYNGDSKNGSVSLARIIGPREQLVREGSTVTLTCEVRTNGQVNVPPPVHHHLKPTRLVDWLFEGQLLTFQSTRGGISVDTERSAGQVWSRLTLAGVSTDDMGRYTCKALHAPPAVVTLIVVEGEVMEAMQGGDRSNASNRSLSFPTDFYFIIMTLFTWKLFGE